MAKFALSKLKGRSIVGSKGRLLGVLEDVEIDTSRWVVAGLIIKVHPSAVKDLGVKKPFLKRARLTIAPARISSVRDMVMLNLSLEDFSKLLSPVPTAKPAKTK